jgi:hypothetical protein
MAIHRRAATEREASTPEHQLSADFCRSCVSERRATQLQTHVSPFQRQCFAFTPTVRSKNRIAGTAIGFAGMGMLADFGRCLAVFGRLGFLWSAVAEGNPRRSARERAEPSRATSAAVRKRSRDRSLFTSTRSRRRHVPRAKTLLRRDPPIARVQG